MSHYTVAVFHRDDQDLEDLLAPYSENLRVEPYIRYTKQEAIDYVRKNIVGYGVGDGKSDEECWDFMAKDYDDKTDGDGNIYSTYNPNSKWDWYCVGGRWSGELVNGDEAKIKDIDFSLDKEKYDEAIEFWNENVIGDGNEGIYKKEYYTERYKTAEKYAECCAGFNTYAVVTPDGKWHAPGEMWWFGVSTESDDECMDWYDHYKERFIDTADPEWILTIVDCHI